MGYPGNQTDLVTIVTTNAATPPYPGRFFNKIVGSAPGDLTVQGSGLHKYVVLDGEARSAVFSPGNAGVLDAAQSILSSATVTAGTTASGDTSGAVVVTRDGVVVTSSVTAPDFSDITVAEGAVTAIVVGSTEGATLQQGDVLTFPLNTASSVTLSVTLAEDDLKLSPGYYQYKATADYVINIGIGEVIEGHFTKITADADVKCVAYMN